MTLSGDERTTPLGLFQFAHSYAASAIMLTRHPTRSPHRDAPVRYLFAHAAELYLKSFCCLNGATVRELSSRKLGHDLEALGARATELGLHIDSDLIARLAVMNDAILDRYIVTGARQVLENEEMLSVCARLNNEIGPLIYKAERLSRTAPLLDTLGR